MEGGRGEEEGGFDGEIEEGLMDGVGTDEIGEEGREWSMKRVG